MIKKFVSILAVLPMVGCGIIDTGPREASPEYLAYLEAETKLKVEYYKTLRDTPRFKMKLPAPNGQAYEIESYDKPEWAGIEQEQQSEWAPVVREGVSKLGLIGTIWAAGSFAENILSAAAGATYQSGGGHISLTNVGNKQVAAGSGTHTLTGQETNPTSFIMAE